MVGSLVPGDIPSPSSGTWTIGPLSLNAYGLMIALGVIVAVWLFGRRLEARGIGTRDDANTIAIWAVVAGVVGARLYHVITDWSLFEDDFSRIFRIWEGGLGIPGALVLGGLVGAYVTRVRQGIPLGPAFNAVAPAVPLAQAIGRWGNWFNQELFGGPTSLPWALQIDPQFRPVGFEEVATFHPTFLYESLWNIGVALLVVWADRRWRLGHGRAFALYVAAYTVGRGWIEYLRIDPAEDVLGLRLNVWVSLLVLLGAIAYLVVSNRRHPGREAPETLRITAAEPSQHGSEAGPAQ